VLHQEMRGCHLREQPRPPLCAVALEATMRFAAGHGYRRMAAQIDNNDAKGIRLAKMAGFGRVGHADKEHGVWAAGLR
jgi:L-amino acid N-acyltransferase YncA